MPTTTTATEAAPAWRVFCPDGEVRHDVDVDTIDAARRLSRSCRCAGRPSTHVAFDMTWAPDFESGGIRL